VWTGNELLMLLRGVSGPEHGHLMILLNDNHFVTDAAQLPKTLN
jgi:hypothetical protein